MMVKQQRIKAAKSIVVYPRWLPRYPWDSADRVGHILMSGGRPATPQWLVDEMTDDVELIEVGEGKRMWVSIIRDISIAWHMNRTKLLFALFRWVQVMPRNPKAARILQDRTRRNPTTRDIVMATGMTPASVSAIRFVWCRTSSRLTDAFVRGEISYEYVKKNRRRKNPKLVGPKGIYKIGGHVTVDGATRRSGAAPIKCFWCRKRPHVRHVEGEGWVVQCASGAEKDYNCPRHRIVHYDRDTAIRQFNSESPMWHGHYQCGVRNG